MENKHHSSVGIHTDQPGLELPSRTLVARLAWLALIGFAILLLLLAARSIVADLLNARHLDQLVTQNQQIYVRVVEPSLAANGGHLTTAEKAQVNRQQNRESHQIYRDKHNPRTR